MASDNAEAKKLVLQFESLGRNCEFGVVQRAFGAEPMGLFRWASSYHEALVTLLQTRFAIAADPDAIHLARGNNGQEYMIWTKLIGFSWHTWMKQGQIEPEALLARERRRFEFLVERTLEQLCIGAPIWVRADWFESTEHGIFQISELLRGYGPNRLLQVVATKNQTQWGRVEMIGESLARGYIDRFVQPPLAWAQVSSAIWRDVCESAAELLTPVATPSVE